MVTHSTETPVCISTSLPHANSVGREKSTSSRRTRSPRWSRGHDRPISAETLRISISGAGLGAKRDGSDADRSVEVMKALRRSMKSEKADGKFHQHHVSITPKDAVAILPPKKSFHSPQASTHTTSSTLSFRLWLISPPFRPVQVIRALYDYEANPEHRQELSFARGDFFHVIGRENDADWYEACNPSMPNARGLVPVSFFQSLGRTERDSAGSTASGASNRLPDTDSGYSDRSGTNGALNNPDLMSTKPLRMSNIGRGSGAMVYGVVMYDFAAERPDELEAKQGEAIIVIAQSNPEWFVAKPIGRLGGPGLIPVSFIEIKDMSTGSTVQNAQEAVQRAGVPKVEEWKKMTADYKNGSISLGKFDSTSSQQMQMQQDLERMSLSNGGQPYSNGQASNGGYSPGHQHSGSRGGISSQGTYPRPSSSQLLAPVSASIPRYCFANEKFWYILRAVMEDGRHWELSRFYQDFYDFQIALLTEFPEEAGNAGKPRTLPFMPGPVTYVTDAISSGRQQNLDEYIKKLLTMPAYISQCQLVRQLFAPKDGDIEIDPNASDGFDRMSGASQQSSNESPEGDSRQSSRANLNGNGYQPGLSAPPPRSGQHRPQPSVSNGVAQAVHLRSASDLHPPQMDRQGSSLTQKSSGSQVAANSTGALKIKIFYQDDLIAIRVPNDVGYEKLRDKLQSRLGVVGNDLHIQYKDEPSNEFREMHSDDDLDLALQRNPKLTLYVNY
ncbi:MAG: bud emergence protein 1 [Sclerophora amabilis]|nr:MAG: bud emergence protein 1 [Sclerophora amabilis]